MSSFAKKCLLSVYLFFSVCCLSEAHNVDKSFAKLNILDQQVYQLTIEFDTLHLAKAALDFQGTDAELTTELTALSLSELKQLLAAIKQDIQSNSILLVNGQSTPLPEFHGLTLGEVRSLLSNSSRLNGFILPLTTSGRIPKNTEHIAIRFAPALGDVILTVARPSKSLVSMNTVSTPIVLKQDDQTEQALSQWQTAMTYLYQGYVHILPKGLDHILFVLALFLLAKKASSLLWQISAFTIAHTITLALGIFGIVNLPANIVEPIIALSIAYVAIENIFQQKLTHWRLPLIFVFGLLHGLGFASVLLELGLQPAQFITSLVAFNLGVEIGQLTVVALAFGLLSWFYHRPWYRQRIVIPLSAVIALTGSYWFIERIV
ncbi:hypothetical protein tinsulaeT_35390 [Thalassotalea insulae]|uniref:HupE/UreJ family protein n=1 Tax=Thalassotalea insulae TaxID=2056778 RepID=A0ABQ6GY99_9GAMM|nr:HupE/UreJ family protein [Thalassotalea insulae]GLX80199.1 hypothetical protein tinsulaeT_35390 [Thalassotalea insulae]